MATQTIRDPVLDGEALRRVFDRCPSSVQIVDPQGLTVYANQAFADLFEFPDAAAAIGRSNLPDDPAGDRYGVAAALARVLRGDVDAVDLPQASFTTPRGRPVEVGASLTALPAARGVVSGVVIQHRPLDDRRRIAGEPEGNLGQAARLLAEVSEAKERLDVALDAANEGILIQDLAGRIVLANPFAHDLYGVARGRLLGLAPAELAPILRGSFADGTRFDTAFAFGRDGDPEGEFSQEYLLVHPRARAIRHFAGPIYDRAGDLLGRVAILHDVTAERAAVLARDELLSVAAHELKTPLTSLKGFAQLLQRDLGRLERQPAGHNLARSRRYLGAMLDQLDRLAGLIDEILDVTRIEAGRLQLRRERCDLTALLVDTLERVDLDEGRGRHRFAFDAPPDHLVGYWDRGRLDQVVLNLLDNAIKYSPAGGTVRVTLAAREGQAILTVADEGIGIPSAELATLFEPFARAANAAMPAYGGFGLGLYIARRIVEQHGGQIWAESVEGQGSAFHLTLPLTGLKIEDGRSSGQGTR